MALVLVLLLVLVLEDRRKIEDEDEEEPASNGFSTPHSALAIPQLKEDGRGGEI